jgi:hypothetical protein
LHLRLNLLTSGAMIAPVNKTQRLDELVGSVEDLLARLPEGLDPQISALRDKVDDGIFDAWRSISAERLHTEQSTRRMRPLTLSAAVGLAILLALSAKLVLDRMRV